MFEIATKKEVLKERKRIKGIVEDKIKYLIKGKRIKHISVLKRLQKDIYFKIDNPDYVRKESKI